MDVGAFRAAIEQGDQTALVAAIEADPTLVGQLDPQGATPLHLAARAGQFEAARCLIEAGADLEATTHNEHGRRTALHDSYEHGHLRVTDLLLERGAYYDIAIAAALGDTERVRQLLTIDPDLVDDTSTGLSPLGWAGYGQAPAMVHDLVTWGATLGDELCCPCATGNTSMIQAFLDVGANPNALSEGWGARPLHVAVAMPHATDSTSAVELLLTAGADPSATAADRATTPLELARRRQAECDPEIDATRIASYDRIIGLLASVTT